MTSFSVRVDARPTVWADAVEFVSAVQRGPGKTKIVGGQQRDPLELIADKDRDSVHHKDHEHIQRRTSPERVYPVYWVHGNYCPQSFTGGSREPERIDVWLLIVDDEGQFLTVPTCLCRPA